MADQNIDFDYAEQYQKAYLKAIASACHFMTKEGPGPDRGSIDFSICSNRVDYDINIGIDSEIQLQLKTTIVPKYNKDNTVLKYRLPSNNYRDLISKRKIPRYLVVMVLPAFKEQWIQEFHNGIFTAGCCYWVNLSKLPPLNNTEQSVTVDIPLS
ncbi:hypothetical protein BMT54_06345 [Pasteurellaceae bacterium 15-036681]|nr:hypothetical protein BMT54_06345 [Pasteurellaceae bacterium 15-036681]